MARVTCLSYRDLRVERLAVLTALALQTASQGTAQSTSHTAIAVDATTEAASNPLLRSGKDNGAVMAELSIMPEYKVTDERGNTLDLDAVATVRSYSRLYPTYVLGSVTAVRGFRQSERLSGTATLGVVRDLPVDLPTTGIDALVAPQSIRTTINGAANLEWRPDSRTTITPAISALRATYGGDTVLRATRSGQAQLAYGRLVAARTTIGVRPLFAISQTAGQPTLERYALVGTVEHGLSSVMRLNFDLGAEYLPAVRDARLQTASRGAATYVVGSLRLCRETLRLDACVAGELGSQVSALDGFQRARSLHTSVSYRLDERKTLAVLLDYQRISAPRGQAALSAAGGGRFEAGSALARMSWRLTPTLTGSGEAGYIMRRSDIVGRVRSSYVGLRLRLEPRLR